MKKLVSISDLNILDLENIFKTARLVKKRVGVKDEYLGEWKEETPKIDGKIVVCLFFEPSTRTASSFKAATYRLGGHVISMEDVSKTSMAKGESFEDTIRAYASYGDIMVIRHPEEGSAERAAEIADTIPVINAGDGSNEHPTQALLDLFTIKEDFPDRLGIGGTKNFSLGTTDLTFTFVGDLKYGRTVHSLVALLSKFQGATLNYVAIPEFQIEDDFLESLEPAYEGVTHEKHTPTLKGNENWVSGLTPELLSKTDVLYMTRVQKERLTTIAKEKSGPEPDILTQEHVDHLPDTSIIMHPFPRVNEIDTAIDNDSRVRYFDQMKNGVWIRAGLLYHMTYLL